MRTIYKIFLWPAAALLALFIGLSFAHAATLTVVADHASVDINQPVRVDLALDTQGDDVNAIQGEIDFPPGEFSLNEINDGASPVSFWIQAPQETASGVVTFSGIVPNGFQGVASSVFSLWLLPTAAGSGTITIANAEVLRNDGSGTPVSVATSSLVISVGTAVISSTPQRPVSFVTPELFTPVVSSNPDIYGGKYFLAFSTTDKGSGIDYYEVAEVPAGTPTSSVSTWQIAASPYLLTDQTLSSDIYVRAVDHDGNFIVVKVPAERPAAVPFKTPGGSDIWFIVAAALVILLAFVFFMRRRG